MYDHSKQYRCTIIRGKSQKEMDDFLPIYAKVIDEICPCPVEEFEEKFNRKFCEYLPENERTHKTLANHRTEISGKLFGMYYFSEDGNVYQSERTQKFLEDNDQPAFFKDVCYKMQFPNGSQKVATTVLERVSQHISIRPYAFLLKFLLLAEKASVEITKKNIGYYILNSLDVLQGNATPNEVLEAIIIDKNIGIDRTIALCGKASSYAWQHINEQINYLELANLIRVSDEKQVSLNPYEINTINLFAMDWNKKPEFDVYQYNLDCPESRKLFQYDWDFYFSKLSPCANKFFTHASSLISHDEKTPFKTKNNNTELGDEGEEIVFEYEKNRVYAFNPRLVNKVLSLGKTRGLGYDIQSVIAEDGDMAEFVKYIEVKSTKRVTCPSIENNLWIDTLVMTRNEWIAAQQHGKFYSIFRVYFTKYGVYIYILNDIMSKYQNKIIQSTPMTYRIDFGCSAVDNVITN